MSESDTESSNSNSESDESSFDENGKPSSKNSNSIQTKADDNQTKKSSSTESSSTTQNELEEKEEHSSTENSEESSDKSHSSQQNNMKETKDDINKDEKNILDQDDKKEEAETKSIDKNIKKDETSSNKTKELKTDEKKKPEEKNEDKEVTSIEKKSNSTTNAKANESGKGIDKNSKDEKKKVKRKSEEYKKSNKLDEKIDKKKVKRKSEEYKKPRKSDDKIEKKEKKENEKEKANPSISQSNQGILKTGDEQKTNTEEIPKMAPMRSSLIRESDSADYPYKKRKSTVTFEFPAAQNENSKEEFNIKLKKRSKSDDDIKFPQMGMYQNNEDNAHDFETEPMDKETNRTNRFSTPPMNKLSMDPRNIPRRFSKMTIEQIDEVIEIEDRLLDAITFFNKNKDPSMLLDYYELEETPSNVAQIFWGTKDINSSVLGQYLLKKKDMLDAYFMEVEMDKGPIQSLRNALLGPMRFDGESQTVHKVLSAISRCYATKNPEKCDDPDNVLDLYYALIMLNTDLSNPNNKTKMTLEEFIRNTKGANDYLATLSDEELTGYYKNIQKNPLLFQNQSDDFIYDICPKIRGYMKKKSVRRFGTWTRKYFVLIQNCLYYFSDDNPENAKTPLGALYLKGVEPLRNRDTAPLLIRIIAKKKEVKYAKFPNGEKNNPRYVKGIKEVILEAPDRASSSKWFHRIRVAAQMSNFLKDKKDSISSENSVYGADVPDAADDSVEE